MNDAVEAEDAVRNRCLRAARLLAPCESYFVERVSFGTVDDGECVDVFLREGPQKPDIVISLAGLHHIKTGDSAAVPSSFIDEILLDYLPRLPHPWPDDATGLIDRSADLPELVRLRITGPSEVDVVASCLTVYTAMSDDEASLPLHE
ncbi:hypothetical protein HLK59_48320 [Streptomyces sp. S3(2020)]|uniref:hypothetical protein n=1 Tax=Streptomyces sp. S3(2020) TaxID=2732044 RepID=UPI0014892026|nr:hypothetical protein [Streptomyces sp. S3(2020)]NNN37983.1 hypothetical protein [Streptomyces sp. S3(2020)]